MRQAKEQISLRVRAVQSTIIKPGLSRASTQPHSQNTFTGARAKGSASVEAPIPILSVFEKKCNFFFLFELGQSMYYKIAYAKCEVK